MKKENMEYEEYDITAPTYSHTRRAVGLEAIIEIMGNFIPDISNAKVLDAGSGTGNYSFGLATHVKNIIGYELSQGMLN